MPRSVREKPVVMERLVRIEDADRDFDLDFWERVGPEGRLEAVWDLVLHSLRLRGGDGDQPRLQRSVERIQRP